MTDRVPAPLPALLSRERAILAFNRRVLAQAQRADVPLLERLRYICIVSSNLDEFFEVRFADFLEAAREGDASASRRELSAVAAEAHRLIDEQYAVFNDELTPLLQREGIVILNHAERDAAQREWVARFFQKQVRPLLVPVGSGVAVVVLSSLLSPVGLQARRRVRRARRRMAQHRKRRRGCHAGKSAGVCREWPGCTAATLPIHARADESAYRWRG